MCALRTATLVCSKLSSTLRTYEPGAPKLAKKQFLNRSFRYLLIFMYDVSFLPAWCQAAAFEGRLSPCLESNLHDRLVGDVKGNSCIGECQEHVRVGGLYL